jgi:hypothetical protein
LKAWVHSEHKFADALGLTRLEHSKGNYGETMPDALGGLEYAGPPLLLESKSRKSGFPKLIQDAMAQALSYKECKGRVPVVGLHRNGGRKNEDWLCVLQLKDFVEIVSAWDGRFYEKTG